MFRLPRFARDGGHIGPKEMVGMRTWVLLTPSDYGAVYFERAEFTQVFADHNRKLIRDRRKKCPIGYPPPCTVCHIGLDQCARATHFDTYEQRPCKICNSDSAWFKLVDPDNVKSCLDCRHKYYLRKRLEKIRGKEEQGV